MNSIISTLESRATTESATASTNDHVKGVARCTGQYLYDLFFADKGEQTKMDFVRWSVANIDTGSFKTALKDMVEIAAKRGDAFKKTAQNHQSVLRTVYGAWKYAPAYLNQLGADNTTGYQAMRVLGKQALDKAGLKWDGGKATKVDKAIAAMDEAQAMRLAELRRDNPKQEGESDQQHELRCRALLAQEMASEHGVDALMKRKAVADLADKVRKMCGDTDTLQDVIQAILNDGTFDLTIGE